MHWMLWGRGSARGRLSWNFSRDNAVNKAAEHREQSRQHETNVKHDQGSQSKDLIPAAISRTQYESEVGMFRERVKSLIYKFIVK